MTSPSVSSPGPRLPSPHPLRKLFRRPDFLPKSRVNSDAQDAAAKVLVPDDVATKPPLPSPRPPNAFLLHRNSQALTHRRKLEQRLPRGLWPATDEEMFAMVERGARRRQVALKGEARPKSIDLGAWSAFVEATLSPRGDRCLLGHRDRPLALLAWTEGRASLVAVPTLQRLAVSPPPFAVYTPDGQHLLAVAGNDARGQTHLWRSRGRAEAPDRSTLGACRVLALSGSGELVATQNFDPSDGPILRVWRFEQGAASPPYFERRLRQSIEKAHFTNNERSLFFSSKSESQLVDIESLLPTRLKFAGPSWGLREHDDELLSLTGPAAEDASFKLTHVREKRVAFARELDFERTTRLDAASTEGQTLSGENIFSQHILMTAREPSAAQLLILGEKHWRLLDATHLQTVTESAYDASLGVSGPKRELIGAAGTWDTLLLASPRGVAVSCTRSGETQALMCPPVLGKPRAMAWHFEGASVALFAHERRPMLHLWNFDEPARTSSRNWASIMKIGRQKHASGAPQLPFAKKEKSPVWAACPSR